MYNNIKIVKHNRTRPHTHAQYHKAHTHTYTHTHAPHTHTHATHTHTQSIMHTHNPPLRETKNVIRVQQVLHAIIQCGGAQAAPV